MNYSGGGGQQQPYYTADYYGGGGEEEGMNMSVEEKPNPAMWTNKMARPRSGISYDDILSSMSMRLVNGRVQLVSNAVVEAAERGAGMGGVENGGYTGNTVNSYFQPNTPTVWGGSGGGDLYYHSEGGEGGGNGGVGGGPRLTPIQVRNLRIKKYLEQQAALRHIANTKSKKMFFYGHESVGNAAGNIQIAGGGGGAGGSGGTKVMTRKPPLAKLNFH